MSIGYEFRGLTIPKIAGATVHCCRFVMFGADSDHVVDCTANLRALGVASGEPGETILVGQVVDVMVSGIAKVEVHDGSATALGDPLECAAAGRPIKSVTNKHLTCGYLVGPVKTTQDDVTEVLVAHGTMSA